MSNATDVGSIRAGFLVDIADGKRKMTEIRTDLDSTAKKAKESSRSFREMGEEIKRTKVTMDDFGRVLAAIGSTAALGKLTNTVSTLAKEANALSSALSGVKQVAGALNQDINKVTQATEQLANRGVLSLTEAATAIKTGLATGYGIDETVALINTLTDAAAYNREAHYEWGEAVVVAMQGIKAGNSTLTDAAGITTNLSVMYDNYAKSIGTSAAKLTDAQKAQAAYNGMMKEASIFAGNAETALEGYTGTNNAFRKSIEAARVELGEAFLPAVERTTAEMTTMIKDFTGWASQNREVVTTIGAVTAGAMALASAIGILSVAVRGLNTALGPVGWAITAIGALATGIAAYTASATAASETAREFAASQESLNAALAKTNGLLNANQFQQMEEQAATLEEVMKRYNALMDEYTSLEKRALDGAGSVENTHRMFELGDAIQAVTKELKDMGYASVELAQFALTSMNKKLDESLGALVELTRQQQQANIQNVDAVNRLKELSTQYDELNSREKLSEEQKQQLANVVRDLKAEYPDLLTQLDTENRWHIANKGALDEYIVGEENRVNAAIEAAKKTIEAAKVEAETRVRLAKQAMAEIETVENTRNPVIDTPATRLMGGMLDRMFENRKGELQDEVNAAQFEINEANKLLSDLIVGPDAFRTTTGTVTDTSDKKKPKSSKSTARKKTSEEIAAEAYQTSLKYIQYRRDLNKMTEAQELAALQKLQKQYEKYYDIRTDAEVRVYQLKEQMAAADVKRGKEAEKRQFEASADWIEQKTREMTLAGESADAIADMQLTAWTRIRNRYDKDSEYYKRADDKLYGLRVDLIRKTEQAQKEAERSAAEVAKATIKSIEAQKDAELKALDERRKAIDKFYDEQLGKIDKGERARDRAELEAEIAKYAGATSERGKKHYAELLEQLREMDVEDQRQALEEERDAKLEALNEQENDIKSFYDDMKDALETFNGDAIKLYQLTENERLKAFTSTNAAILSELITFKAQYDSIMAGVSTSGSSASVVAQMKANAAAWHGADSAGRAKLAAENQSLGQSIGATYKNGKWLTADNVPLFHKGRDGATGQTFSVGDRLMPDELTAILRRDETVFTPGQLDSLLAAKAGGKGDTNVRIDKLVGLEMHDTVMEDEIDVRALGRNAEDIVSQLMRKQVMGGGK